MADNVTDPNVNRNEHDDTGGVLGKRVKNYVWNSGALAWEKATQASGGGSSDITSVVPGTGATNLGKADDAPMTTGDVGVMALAVANEAQTNLTSTDGDYTPIGVDRAGRVYTKLTDGVNTASVVAGDTGFNGVATTGGVKTLTFTTSVAGAQTILPNTDVRGYNWLEVVYTSVGSGLALSGQFSTASGGAYVTNNNWSTSPAGAPTSALGVTVSTIYVGAVRGNFFQIAVSALTSGTFTGTLTLRNVSPPIVSIGTPAVTQSGTWNVGSSSATGSAVPANAFYIGALTTAGNLRGLADVGGIGSDAITTNALGVGPWIYNGTTWDRQRSATAASNTTGTGLLGVGNLMFDGTNWQNLRTAANDGAGSSSVLTTTGLLLNGASFDRPRNNTTGVVIAAGTTTTQTGITLTTYNASRARFIVNIASGAGTVTVAINETSSSAYSTNLLTSTALVAGTTALRIFPAATPTANLVANDMIGRTLSITATVVGTVSFGIDVNLGR